jgi:hypothetical protein
MDAQDLAIRNATYGAFVTLGRAPTLAEIAHDTGRSEADVRASWHRLHDDHALVLEPDGDRIRMANPFSARETPFRVDAAGRSWFANCGWDAFGVGAALHVDSIIRTACADCDEPIENVVRDGRPSDTELVFHVLVPAASWWTDIGFT